VNLSRRLVEHFATRQYFVGLPLQAQTGAAIENVAKDEPWMSMLGRTKSGWAGEFNGCHLPAVRPQRRQVSLVNGPSAECGIGFGSPNIAPLRLAKLDCRNSRRLFTLLIKSQSWYAALIRFPRMFRTNSEATIVGLPRPPTRSRARTSPQEIAPTCWLYEMGRLIVERMLLSGIQLPPMPDRNLANHSFSFFVDGVFSN